MVKYKDFSQQVPLNVLGKPEETTEKPLDESVEMLLHNGNPAAVEDDDEIDVFDVRQHKYQTNRL